MNYKKWIAMCMALLFCITGIPIYSVEAATLVKDYALVVAIEYDDATLEENQLTQLSRMWFDTTNSVANDLEGKTSGNFSIKPLTQSGGVMRVKLGGNRPATVDFASLSTVKDKLVADGILSNALDLNGDGKWNQYTHPSGRISNEISLIYVIANQGNGGSDAVDTSGSAADELPVMIVSETESSVTPVTAMADRFQAELNPTTFGTTEISITTPPTSLTVGSTATLSAKVMVGGVETTMPITWESSDPAVLEVDTTGKLTAKAKGNAVITAKEPVTGKTATAGIAVTAIDGESITITNKITSLRVGKEHQLTVQLTPANATNQGRSFRSSNPAIASVDGSGLVRGLKEGKTTIIVTSTAYPDKIDTFELTVTRGDTVEVPVESVTIAEEEYNVQLYKTLQLEATIAPENATNKKLRWRVRDSDIATINSDGEVTGQALGKTRITVYTIDGNYSASAILNVTPDGDEPTGEVDVSGVTLERETYNIRVNDVIRLNPVIQPYNADNKATTWETSDPEIAEVDEFGNVWGVGQGIAAITVTTDDNAYKAVTRVLVRPYVTNPEEDTYVPSQDPEYDPKVFEKVMDVNKMKRQIDIAKGTRMTIKLGSEFILPAELIEYIRDNEKIVTFEHTSYKWRLDYREIPEGSIHMDMNLKVTNLPAYKQDMAALLSEDASPIYLDFLHSGDMPAPMTFIYRTNRSSPNKGFYLYTYNSGYDQLEIADDKLKTDNARFLETPMVRCLPSVLTATPQDSNPTSKYNPFTGR